MRCKTRCADAQCSCECTKDGFDCLQHVYTSSVSEPDCTRSWLPSKNYKKLSQLTPWPRLHQRPDRCMFVSTCPWQACNCHKRRPIRDQAYQWLLVDSVSMTTVAARAATVLPQLCTNLDRPSACSGGGHRDVSPMPAVRTLRAKRGSPEA